MAKKTDDKTVVAKLGRMNGKATAMKTAAEKKATATKGKGKASTKAKGAAAPAPAPKEEVVIVRMGRPLKYTPEICQRMIEFFNIEVESVVEVPVQTKDGKTIIENQKVLNRFPTLTRFAALENLTRETLHDWATAKNGDGTLRYPDFSYAYTRARDLQDALITEGGMAGMYESRFAAFAAKNLVGWKDQIEQTITQDITTSSKDDLDAIYNKGIEESERMRAEVEKRNKPPVPPAKG